MDSVWFVHGRLVTPRGIVGGAICVRRGRIAAIRPRAPQRARTVELHGAYLAPGFIDLHVWGEPKTVSAHAARDGTTAFLSTLGPEPAHLLARHLAKRNEAAAMVPGAQCLGAHLEGPFLNPRRGGALPRRWMRFATLRELRVLQRVGGIRLMTLAPERPGGLGAIRWCRRHGIVASLGHSEAQAIVAQRAIRAGATAATHVFNGMAPWHHRKSTLLDVVLTDPRVTAMAILDGVHISPSAFRLLVRAKGSAHVALVTDAIRHQGWDVRRQRGAYYTRSGTLAGSGLTMIRAVRNATRCGMSVQDAVSMAATVPARLLGLLSTRGTLEVGKRADLVAFDRAFRVRLTMVGGRVVYQARGR